MNKTIAKLQWLIPGLASLFLISAAAKSATIADWHFDRDRNQLNFTTDEDIQPQVQLISNPTRLVIDLPGVTLGRSQLTETIGTAVQAIRIGQFDADTTRLVIALSPELTLDPAQVKIQADSSTHWHVQITPLRHNPTLLPDHQDITVPLPPIASILQPDSLFAGVIPIHAPMAELRSQVRSLMAEYSFLQTGMFFLDLESGNYLDIGGDRVFPAASTIKLPILVAFFQDLDAGKVSLDETLTLRADLITDGSGSMQDEPVGTQFSALETVTKMITISDNTATNLIIDRLGGIDRLNDRFRSWELQDTVIHHLLSDLSGTNTTSSQDMVKLLALVVDNKLLSSQSKEQVLDILRHTSIRTLLPAGLGAGADIANKTGDIGFLIGDAGLITMPSGRQYLAGIFVKRPYDDPRGRDFIQQVSRLVYNFLDQHSTSENPAATVHSE